MLRHLACCGWCVLALGQVSLAQERDTDRDFGGRPEASGMIPGKADFGGEGGGQPDAPQITEANQVDGDQGSTSIPGSVPESVDASQLPYSESSPQTDQTPTAKWRYRWYEGTWWYWAPSKKWFVWAVDRWVSYETLASGAQATLDDAESADSSGGDNYSSGGTTYYNQGPGAGYAFYPRGYRVPLWLWAYRFRGLPYAGARYPYAGGRYPYGGGGYPFGGGNRYRAGYGNYDSRPFAGGANGPRPGNPGAIPGVGGDRDRGRGAGSGFGGVRGGSGRGGAGTGGAGMRGGAGGGGRR